MSTWIKIALKIASMKKKNYGEKTDKLKQVHVLISCWLFWCNHRYTVRKDRIHGKLKPNITWSGIYGTTIIICKCLSSFVDLYCRGLRCRIGSWFEEIHCTFVKDKRLPKYRLTSYACIFYLLLGISRVFRRLVP